MRGEDVSIGFLTNSTGTVRVGIRTRRGMKGATHRNRLRRQVRAIVYMGGCYIQPGTDLIVVIHPTTLPISSGKLEKQLQVLCKRTDTLR